MNFNYNVGVELTFLESIGFVLLVVELGFFFFCFFFFVLFLILSPFTPASRFSWMFALLVSLVFFFFVIFNTLDIGDLLDNGIYFSQLNQFIKAISFLAVIGFCFAGISFSTSLFTFEYIVLILFSQSAGLFILSTDHLPLIFILIEVQALIGYTLVVYRRKSQAATEAGMKYFLLGSISSSLMVFGIVLLYGSVGSFFLSDLSLSFENYMSLDKTITDYNELSSTLFSSVLNPTTFGLDLRFLGAACLLLGFIFKLSAAPLHFWTPEVYENVEFLTLSYFSSIPKISVLALLTGQAMFLVEMFRDFILISGVLSLVVGSVGGLFQDSLKKIFAYSTIANTGYLLVVLSACSGLNRLFFSDDNLFFDISYLAIWSQMGVYIITFIAVCGFLQFVSSGSEFDSLLPLTYSTVKFRLCFLVLLVSLSGVPPTAGFFAKFLMLYVVGNNVFLSVVIMVASVLTLFYYMRIAGVAFFYTREHEFFTSVERSLFKKNNAFLNYFFIPTCFLNLGFLLVFWFIDLDSILILFLGLLR